MNTPRYTVRRIGWFQPPHGDPYTRRVPGAAPVASFDTFDGAEMHRRELEADERAGENPFRFGGASVFFQSSLDGPRLHDWLMDEGIEPPASALRHADWRLWWDAFAHTWSSGQLAHAWAGLDKVRFYEVVENESDPAHVVVEIVWGRFDRDGGARSAGTEGGRLARVFRRGAAAEADRARRNAAPAQGHAAYRYDHRAGYEAGRVFRAPQATFFEVAAVPSDVPPLAGMGYLVQRRALSDRAPGLEWRDRPASGARVPVALFARRGDAEAHRDRLNAEARATINPFVFLGENPERDFARDEVERLGLPLPLPARRRVPGHALWWEPNPAREPRREWVEWWDLCQDEATDEQRAALWAVCDQPLFEVLRVEVSDD